MEAFESAIGYTTDALGFPFYACIVFRARGQLLARNALLLRRGNMPAACLDLDRAMAHLQPDSIPVRAAESRRPFVWRRECGAGTTAANPDESGISASLRQSVRGLAVPVHGPQGEFGLFSVGAPAHDPDFPERVEMYGRVLRILAAEAHALAVEKFVPPPAPVAGLTPREREVLRWIAFGKTSYEIAVILQRSEATVNFHLAAVLRKLEASNRPHAVLKALELEELSL